MNDEMAKRNATRTIKQQTNQNKLIGMKEFLQSLLGKGLRKIDTQTNKQTKKSSSRVVKENYLNHSINVIRDCHCSHYDESFILWVDFFLRLLNFCNDLPFHLLINIC